MYPDKLRLEKCTSLGIALIYTRDWIQGHFTTESHLHPFFFNFAYGLATLLKLALNLQSSQLRLPSCWD